MVMVEGEETIYVKPTDRLTNITAAYDPAGDYLLAEFDQDGTPVHMTPGTFIILLPQDAHAPGCWYKESTGVKKIVGKVRI
jgi:YhcH/YjgK/YiaL family protein